MKGVRKTHRVIMGHVPTHGAGSLSSLVAALFDECGAVGGYTQNGQCKRCSQRHDPPNFTSSNPVNNTRMLELLRTKGWSWHWSENSGGTTELVLTKKGEHLSVIGAPREAALIIGTLLVCAPAKLRTTFSNLLSA